MAMKSDFQQHNPIDKQPYEPPKAAIVPVQLEERVLGCNFSTIKNCGLTE
jgi:hypothetical protein